MNHQEPYYIDGGLNEFKLDGKDSCENQECSSWMHNKVLPDHGEPDDVDSDGDFRFDMIYRHHDVEDGVSIEKGNLQDGRDEIKIS